MLKGGDEVAALALHRVVAVAIRLSEVLGLEDLADRPQDTAVAAVVGELLLGPLRDSHTRQGRSGDEESAATRRESRDVRAD